MLSRFSKKSLALTVDCFDKDSQSSPPARPWFNNNDKTFLKKEQKEEL